MDEYASSSFQNPNPISKKRRSITTRKRRSRPTPHSPPDQTAFRKKEFLLNAHPPPPPPTDAADEVRSKRSTGGSQSALYRRGQTHTAIAIRENKVTKLKVKVSGVSRTIHQHKEENLHIAEPTRKSVRVNKRRVLDEEGPPPPSPHYEKPVADTKAKKKRLPKDLPSDGSTDYKTGEEEEAAVVIAADVPHMEGAKMKNLTSRQRAMLTGGKDSGTVEFPEGLPPAPSRSKNRTLNFVTNEDT